MHKTVFISHSIRDKAAALSVCSALESNGVNCWIAPRDIVAGVKWAAAIAEAIESSAAIALILTVASNESPNVADEVNLAKKFDVPILSIRIEDVQPAKHLELFLSSSHWFDAHQAPLDRYLGNLVRDFQRLIDESDVQKPASSESLKDTAQKHDTTREPQAADSSLHRELLFGVVAAQFEFITQQQFLAVCAEWCATKSDSVGEMLVARNWIEEEDRVAIDALHRRKIAKHRGNAPAALLASSDGLIRNIIRNSQSPEISRSLDGIAGEPDGDGGEAFNRISRQSRFNWTRLHRAGGLGHIWLADDTELGRTVAIKTLPPDQRSPAAMQMLLNEARIAARLEHPNIVPIYEVGRREDDDEPFYAMRLLRGETLTEAIKRMHSAADDRLDSVERRRLLNVLYDVCNAVAYAHSQGVCHLDLKPDNVVVGMFNEVNLLDWGLAQQLGDSPSCNLKPRGTPAYMAPEQSAGRNGDIGTRTDVYGLGAILYEILTGRPPHEEPTEITGTVLRPSPSGIRSEKKSPQALVAICEKAMSVDISQRHESAITLAEEIQSYLRDEPLEAYRAAVRRARELCKNGSDSEPLRDNLARSLMNVGVVLDGMERFEEAEQGLAEAIDEYRWLKDRFPENLQYRVNFATACLQRRTALDALGRHSEAEQMSRNALWEYEDIIRKGHNRRDFISVYESMLTEMGACDEESENREDEIAADEPFDSNATPEHQRDKKDLPEKIDRWVVPEYMHTILFATEALRCDKTTIDQLRDAVLEMLDNNSSALDQHLIDMGVLNRQQCTEISSAVRDTIRRSNAERQNIDLWESHSTINVTPIEILPNSYDTVELYSGSVATPELRDDESWHFTDIERFEIVKVIGKGGWGQVSLARDREAFRYAAVKELSQRLMDQPKCVERFLYEARFAASFKLPSSPEVYAIGRFPDMRPYYAMQFIDGYSIEDLMASNSGFTLADAIWSLIRVADCLHAAHLHGFIHRDVKPKHILIDSSGETYFTDWGLVKCFVQREGYWNELVSSLASMAPQDQEYALVGTPAFMSPEQAQGKTHLLGPATDIYLLGATLYSLLAGRPPHYARAAANRLQQARRANVLPPSKVSAKRVPQQLEAICMKALARGQKERFLSAKEFGLALQGWAAREPESEWFEAKCNRKGD